MLPHHLIFSLSQTTCTKHPQKFGRHLYFAVGSWHAEYTGNLWRQESQGGVWREIFTKCSCLCSAYGIFLQFKLLFNCHSLLSLFWKSQFEIMHRPNQQAHYNGENEDLELHWSVTQNGQEAAECFCSLLNSNQCLLWTSQLIFTTKLQICINVLEQKVY